MKVSKEDLMGHVARHGSGTQAFCPHFIGQNPVPLPQPKSRDIGKWGVHICARRESGVGKHLASSGKMVAD